MDAAEEAYEAAKAEIARVKAEGVTRLELSGRDYRALEKLPPEIAQLRKLRSLSIVGTAVSDLLPIAELFELRTLFLNDSAVSELSPLANLKRIEVLTLDGSRVVDLRPIIGLKKLENGSFPGLSFRNTKATAFYPKLAELAEIEDHASRAQKTFAYLRRLPQWPEPYVTAGSALSDFASNNENSESSVTGELNKRIDEIEEQIFKLLNINSDVLLNQKNNLTALENLSELSERAESLDRKFMSLAEIASSQKESEKEMNSLLEKIQVRIEKFQMEAEVRIKESDERYQESIQAAAEAFREGIAISAPVDLWKNKQEEHEESRDTAFRYFLGGLIGVAILVVGILLVFIFGTEFIEGLFAPIGCNMSAPETCIGFSLRGWLSTAGVLTLFTILLWFTRLQMKLYLAERHLVLDARERRAFAEVYVGLLKEGDTSTDAKEQRALVYSALFRPASDGTVNDEGGLDPTISAALSKFLSK